MPLFTYSAYAPDGTLAAGQIDAHDRAEAFAFLGQKSLQPVSLKTGDPSDQNTTPAVSADTSGQSARQSGIKLKPAQLSLFTEELAELLESGIQLEPALATMERRRELSALKEIATALRAKVREGAHFSDALAETSPSFGKLYCNLVAAGEAGGALPTILRRQAKYLNGLQALRGKVLFALIYPSFLIASSVAVGLLFLIYLIPKLTSLLDSTGGSLPAAAQAILNASDFFKSTWWAFAAVAVLGTLTFIYWRKQPSSHLPWSRFVIRIPLFGRIIENRFHVQFLETLSNLVGNGLPLTKALELTKNATPNVYFQQKVAALLVEVAEGTDLSDALDHAKVFPPLLVDMVSVGEQTGNLADALSRTATRFDKELEKRIDRLSALIQPSVVVVMATMVGLMAYLMITAIFQTISGLNGG